jgi:hypothetical protein
MGHLMKITHAGLIAIILSTTALGSVGRAMADTVVLGSDYFTSEAGTQITYDGQTIDLTGNPIGPGATDAIIQRTSNITIGSSGSLLMTALSLKSTNLSIPIYVTLDAAKTADDTGTINIMGSAAGGTFSTTLDLYIDICTTAGSGGVGCIGSPLTAEFLMLTSADASWVPTAPASAVIVSGPVGTQAADVHTGLTTGQVDFFVAPPLTVSGPQNWFAPFAEETPIPAALPLFATGLGVMGLFGWSRKRKSAARQRV